MKQLETKKSLNIALGKIGKTTQFKNSRWGAIGGDSEAPLTILALAEKYPQHNFYIISRCGIPKDFRLPSNVFYILGEYSKAAHKSMSELAFGTEATEYQEAIVTWLRALNITIDFGILHFGCTFACSTLGNRRKLNGDWIKNTCAAQQYQGMIIETLNQLKFPWLGIVTDPRQLQLMSDLQNYPKVLLSQISEPWELKGKIWSKGICTEKQFAVPQVYAGLEKMLFLKDEGLHKPTIKKVRMGLLLNEGIKRGPILEEFGILDDPNVRIYGKWSDQWTASYPNFKGLVPLEKVNSTIREFKYTFCIPIKEGWMTAKFDEMIHHGVFPFLHESYGSKANNHGIPEFFFVKDKEELFSKMLVLDKDENLYNMLMSNARKRLEPEVYDGTYVTNVIADAVSTYLGEEL